MQKQKPDKTDMVNHENELLQKTITVDDLREALKNEEFVLYYQPQINSRSGCLTGMEALLRWVHPEKGFISPQQFIPIAEETGQIIEIGDWALRAACRQRKSWNDMGLLEVPVAVNMSPCQLEDPQIIKTITEILQETGLDSKWLELEITESSAISNFNDVAGILKHLKKLKLSVAIDDFGTGNATLNYLRMFPIDTIKIDKSFVDKIGVDTTDEAILRSIISLILSLDLRVVAEGVEKKHQIDFLMAEGCDIIQGFYYYKPLPARNMEKLLRKNAHLGNNGPMQFGGTASEETEIYRYLELKLGGIKHSGAGCRYLLTAIAIGTKMPYELIKITDLYRNVAEIYSTKPANVERSIRYCLHPHGWNNKEFVYRAIEHIQYNKFQAW